MHDPEIPNMIQPASFPIDTEYHDATNSKKPP